MLRQYSTSTEWCINVCNSLVYLQWSTPCCSHHILVMYSTALAVSVSSLVLGLVLSQEGSGILPAGHEEILAYPYVDSFSCEGQAYGYYADVDSGCQVGSKKGRKRKKKIIFSFFQVFHICLPIEDNEGQVIETAKWSFFCGNATVFDQETLTCNHPEDAFPCEESPSLYGAVEFGKIDSDY